MARAQQSQSLPIPIIKGDKSSADVDYRDNLLTNMFGVVKDIKGAKGYIMSHYGLDTLATGKGRDRGANWNERLRVHYRASGDRLISVNQDGTVVDQGYIGGFKQTSMPYSFNTQGILSDGRFFLHNGASLSEITDPDLGTPIDAVWIDGYYFMTDGEYLFHTNIADETKIDPLTFATAEFSPDPTLGLGTTQDNKVIVFGRYTTEYFQNIASENFAFTRLSNRALKVGIVGTHAKCELAGQWFIMGGRKEESPSIGIVSVSGYQQMTTREIDKIISIYSEVELANVVLESRQDDANQFLLVRLPRHTLMLNLTLAQKLGADNAWTILKVGVDDESMPLSNGVFDPRSSKWVYGESNSSRIGTLERNICTYYDDAIEQIFYTPQINFEDVSIREIELDTIPGFTVDNASVMMSMSYDGLAYGKEQSLSYGADSSHNKRFRAWRLGNVYKDFNFKFRTTSKSRMIFSKLTVKYG